MIDVIVIGAGASGLTAGIMAARRGASVLILEHKESPGKKLLMTGNGKCNLSHEGITAADYRGDRELAGAILEEFGFAETRSFFLELGVPFRNRRGYYYPQNEEARGVLSALVSETRRLGIKIEYEIGIKKILPKKGVFSLETKQGERKSRSVILATGGSSYPETGSDGSGFLYLEALGHKIRDLVPSLVQMKADGADFPALAGIRADTNILIKCGDRVLAEESGELQLTDYGVSGIPVFQISRAANTALLAGQEIMLFIDFLPAVHSLSECIRMYRQLFSGQEETISQLLLGSVHRKLIPELLKKARLKDLPGRSVSEAECEALSGALKAFPVRLLAPLSLKKAQVTAGGVDTSDLRKGTLESAYHPGLFFCGEMLDVDGPCGGYNLQWAFSSGAVAGLSAAAKVIRKT